EIVLEARLGIAALLLADDGDGLAPEAAETGLDRLVLGELAVTGKRREILKQPCGIIEEMRTLGMPRDLRLLPGCQLGIDVDRRFASANLQAADLVARIDALIFLGEFLQLVDLAFEVGD